MHSKCCVRRCMRLVNYNDFGCCKRMKKKRNLVFEYVFPHLYFTREISQRTVLKLDSKYLEFYLTQF